MFLASLLIAAAVVMPGTPETKLAMEPTPFPDRMSAYVFRNWFVVPHERLAKTVKASVADLEGVAAEMGLPKTVEVLPQWRRKGYITILRRNWHLLNYDQLTEVLDMSHEELRRSLLNDDFLYHKLGSIKPKAEPLFWDGAAVRKTVEARQRIAAILKAEGADDFTEEPRFKFIGEMSAPDASISAAGDAKTSPFDFRMVSSYFADFGDPLADPEIGSYPEGLLQRLAAEGVNAVWFHAVLSELTRDPKYPEFGEGSEARVANLQKLVDRAAKYGIKVYLYINEPRQIFAEFFEKNDERRGLRGCAAQEKDGTYARCTSVPENRRWVHDSLKQLFSSVHGLGGCFVISMSENLTHCGSRGAKKRCERCKNRPTEDLVAEILTTIINGVHAGDPKAQVIVYDWAWDQLAPDATERITAVLPKENVRILCVSEGRKPFERGGVKNEVRDYSISVVGPGERAKRAWSVARKNGIGAVAKVQAACSWELSAFPYLPVMDLVAQHAANLANEGVNGVMLTWSLGGCPSPNLRVYRDFKKGETNGETVLDRIATHDYGEAAAPIVRKAWSAFSKGFAEFPFSIGVIYNGPFQMGPANPLYAKPTGYHATMVGLPYDDVNRWRANYPTDVWIAQTEKVAAGFREGCEIFAEVVKSLPVEQQAAAERELAMFRAQTLHFQSSADQARFVQARDRGDWDAMRNLAAKELATAKAMLKLVRADSRFGYECSNQYFYIPQDLREKILSCRAITDVGPTWPSVTNEIRPWVYNWWMASAVDERGLEAQCKALEEGGFGGFHVIPIYGAKGFEKQYKTYLTDDWMAAFADAVKIGQKHGLGVDMTTGCGWCFGGPQLAKEQGCWKLAPTKDGKAPYVEPKLTGQQVKRAGPGGQGPMMDPFSIEAIDAFMKPFTAAFDKPGAVKPLRMYHDSYEYYGAGWTPKFPELFKQKRGYDLMEHWEAFAGGKGDQETIARLKCDYRETLSDLIIEDVFPRWVKWCHERGIETRNEAHGAVANWLDFYELADYPETEMYGFYDRDILRSKFASSVAHVAGKAFTSAESCTWLNEHFKETLHDYKVFLDRLLIAGVDKVYYHGCCYSPVDVVWPGWCFYASSETNPRNPLWHDFGYLNDYVTRVQSISRNTKCDNDLLVYWPLYDYWSKAEGFELMMTVHAPEWFDGTEFGRIARSLYETGHQFDYISDRQLNKLDFGRLPYRKILIPAAKRMPLKTAKRLVELAEAGYEVIFAGGYPKSVPGFKDHVAQTAELKALFAKGHPRFRQIGAAQFPEGVRVEPFNRSRGLTCWRRVAGDTTYYFIVNECMSAVADDFKPTAKVVSAWEMDPITGKMQGAANADGSFHLELEPFASTIVAVSSRADASGKRSAPVSYDVARPLVTAGWKLTPVCGGPKLPQPRQMERLTTWSIGADGKEDPFSGTMRYETTFAADEIGRRGWLDLGQVAYSARVKLNGVDLGCRFMAPYRFEIPSNVLQAANTLVVEVTSTGANRLRWNDRTGVNWKYFRDANMCTIWGTVTHQGSAFDAARWGRTDYGLFGPVRMTTENK